MYCDVAVMYCDVAVLYHEHIPRLFLLLQNVFRMRNAIVDKSMRWTNGIVPYEISASFSK